MQLAKSQSPKSKPTRACTTVRAAADAKLIGKAGNLYRIPLRLIRFRENFNLRDYEDAENQERVMQFRLAYREGRNVPPPELEWENGFAYVVEGHRRVLAARAEDKADLVCLAFTGDEFERHSRLHTAAADTRFSPLESAKGLADMKRKFPGRSNADIAAATGRSTQAVEQALVLDSASDELKAMILAGQIDSQAVITLVRQHGPHAEHAARELYERLKADAEAREVKPVAAGVPQKDDEATKPAKSKKPAKATKPKAPKAPKVTVQAMRGLKAKDAVERAATPATQLNDIVAAFDEFARVIGADEILAELETLDAANDRLYTLEIEAPLMRRVLRAWQSIRSLAAKAA